MPWSEAKACRSLVVATILTAFGRGTVGLELASRRGQNLGRKCPSDFLRRQTLEPFLRRLLLEQLVDVCHTKSLIFRTWRDPRCHVVANRSAAAHSRAMSSGLLFASQTWPNRLNR